MVDPNTTIAIVGVLLGNAVLGTMLVYGSFSLIEENPLAGIAGGGFLGLAIIWTEATVGERMLTISLSEMKILVLAATTGGLIGVVGTMMLIKPKTD